LCSIKGVVYKDLGENHFVRAGPCKFGKDLVIMVDFEETKFLEELEFMFVGVMIPRISHDTD
jgi:hypothetical protein